MTISEPQDVFQLNYNSDITYSDDWGCVYPDGAPIDVYPNHYGASPIRPTLHDLESSYFTEDERALMKDTAIFTNDTKNDKVAESTNANNPSNDDEAGSLAQTGDQLPSNGVLLSLVVACLVLLIVIKKGKSAYLRQDELRH